jgi:hypothetical protein
MYILVPYSMHPITDDTPTQFNQMSSQTLRRAGDLHFLDFLPSLTAATK